MTGPIAPLVSTTVKESGYYSNNSLNLEVKKPSILIINTTGHVISILNAPAIFYCDCRKMFDISYVTAIS